MLGCQIFELRIFLGWCDGDRHTQLTPDDANQPWQTLDCHGSEGYTLAWVCISKLCQLHLNPENKIFFVAIDLLASAKELLNLAS